MRRLSRFEGTLARLCGAAVAPGGRHGSLLVLTYHRVLAEADPLLPDQPDAATFAAHMDLLRDVCTVLPVTEAVDRLFDGTLPPRAACVTFDDGYANNHLIAAPILAERGIRATVFVATGFIGLDRMWNDTVIESVRGADSSLDLSDLGLGRFELRDASSRRRAIDVLLGALKYRPLEARAAVADTLAERAGKALPPALMMTEAQIRELPGLGFEVGAHTVSHPILSGLEARDARREIVASKAALESIIGERVRTFAYPNGRPGIDYDATHARMVCEAGFSAAFSTVWGAASSRSDRYQMPRMLPWESSAFGFATRLLRTYGERPAAAA